MEDEIDLRKYIDVLLRHWKLIVSITVIAVFVAGLVSFLSPSVYEAKAQVLITKFAPQYQAGTGAGSQREALIALATSSAVATQVIEQLGDELEPGEKRVKAMLGKVQVGQKGDLIEITLKSSDPKKAADIANTWAEVYENYVNSLYSGISQSLEELRAQANVAKQEYKERQKVWEDFVKDNRTAELSQQISDKEVLCDLKSLREQVKAGSSSSASAAADSLALILLQTRALSSLPVESLPVERLPVERLPVELRVSLDRLSGLKVSVAGIDALISTLEARSGTPSGRSISELRQDILQLRGELAQEDAKERELQRLRDISRNTYESLDESAAAIEVEIQLQDTVVRVAEVALVPEHPVTARRAMNIGIALVLGLVIGVFGAFGVEYFQKTGDKPEEGKREEEVG